ncbi:MAG TPA: N-acetylglucosamine-6-phosphate deacetylase, partial [Sphingobacteriaceae bacterium]|nr:N-acetylglucosamine-6-phosphate deacetylase [Sphingobacteriaceae bacterium]
SIVELSQIPSSAEIIDLQGQNIAPGLIDLQIYGAGRKMFGGTPSTEALAEMENVLLSQGCTGFFAAVATNTPSIVEQAIQSAKEYRKKAIGNFWGLHLEGPYLNPKCKGAHPEELIKKGTLQELKSWVEQAEGEIKMMTIAPELQDRDVIDYLNDQGIIISAGHSNATYEEAIGFINNPVQACTHIYNAMSKIHHREPGLVPAIFEMKPYTSVVADGIHVSFPMIKLAKRELADHLFLITDAVTETSEGIYPHVFKGDRYTMPDGTLSGSCLTMLKAVKNCVKHIGISLEEALKMGSLYPATLIGKSDMYGKIKPGYKADIVTFSNDFRILNTFLSGNISGSTIKN